MDKLTSTCVCGDVVSGTDNTLIFKKAAHDLFHHPIITGWDITRIALLSVLAVVVLFIGALGSVLTLAAERVEGWIDNYRETITWPKGTEAMTTRQYEARSAGRYETMSTAYIPQSKPIMRDCRVVFGGPLVYVVDGQGHIVSVTPNTHPNDPQVVASTSAQAIAEALMCRWLIIDYQENRVPEVSEVAKLILEAIYGPCRGARERSLSFY